MSCVPLNSQQKMDSSGNIPVCGSQLVWVFHDFVYHWSQMTVEMAWDVAQQLVLFTNSKKKKTDHVMANFMIVWWEKSVNLSYHQERGFMFFCKFFFSECRTLSSKIQFKICYREGFERSKIYRMDKICLELVTIEEFVTAALQTVAKRCLSSCDQLF